MRTTKHTMTLSNAEWVAIIASLKFYSKQIEENRSDEFAQTDATYLRTVAKFIRGTMDANYENEEV